METFKPRISSVKGVSEQRRMPRIGKIALGYRGKNKNGNTEKCKHSIEKMCAYCSHPVETDYFVCHDPGFNQVYGDHPKELDIVFPVNDREAVFPQALKWYGGSKGLKCQGNKEKAFRRNETTGAWDEMTCPCEHLDKDCLLRGNLYVMLPDVHVGGVFQIDCGSYHSIVDVNSGIDYVTEVLGFFAMVRLKLKRIPRETHEGGIKSVHYTMHVHLPSNADLKALRDDSFRFLSKPPLQLPEPLEDVNPVYDMEAEVVDAVEENGLLKMGSKLHGAVEAMIGEKKWDRVLLHEYLLEKGRIELNEEGKPSFKTMKEEFARNWLDRPNEFNKAFAAWLMKKDSNQQ
jgi:hypothetical protein